MDASGDVVLRGLTLRKLAAWAVSGERPLLGSLSPIYSG